MNLNKEKLLTLKKRLLANQRISEVKRVELRAEYVALKNNTASTRKDKKRCKQRKAQILDILENDYKASHANKSISNGVSRRMRHIANSGKTTKKGTIYRHNGTRDISGKNLGYAMPKTID